MVLGVISNDLDAMLLTRYPLIVISFDWFEDLLPTNVWPQDLRDRHGPVLVEIGDWLLFHGFIRPDITVFLWKKMQVNQRQKPPK